MAYSKTTWKDRVVQKPLTYTLQNNGDGTTTLIPAEGTIVEPGTAITASVMNNLEKQYDEALNYFISPPVVWTNLTLQNGATINNSRTPKFSKQGNLVVLQGEIANMTGVIGTFPVGYRPKAYPLTFSTALASSTAGTDSKISVSLDGTINVLGNSNTGSAITLNGITFIAEQ